MYPKRILIAGIFAIGILANALNAQTTLRTAEDATMTQFQNQFANLGGADKLFLYNEPAGRYRPVIRFDLSSVSASSVSSATLRLYQLPGDHYAGQDMFIEFYPLVSNWVEGNGTDHFNPGSGVSWRRSGTGNFWYEPGGDYEFSDDFGFGPNGLVGGTTLTPAGDGQWMEFDITPIVNQWLSGSRPNNGIGIFLYGGLYSQYNLASSEHSTFAPELVLNGGGSGGSGDKLFTKSDLVNNYLGSFRMPPNNAINGFSFSGIYGGTALTVAPNGTLYTMAFEDPSSGNPHSAPVLANISVPNNLNQNSSSSVISYVDLRGKLETNPFGGGNVTFEGNSYGSGIRVDDLVLAGGNIVGSAYVAYDSGGQATHSHFLINQLNLNNVSDANVFGLFDISQGLPAGLLGTDGTDAGFVAGYMAEIPPARRAALSNFTHIGGQAGTSIISRTNAGPAAYLFNANAIDSGTPVVPVAHYPLISPLSFEWRSDNSIIVDTPVFNQNTHVEGVFFAPGTRSVLFLGATGAESQEPDSIALTYYGNNNDHGQLDRHRIYQGPHSIDGNYEYQVWAFDINDFEAVANGQLDANAIRPYEVFRFDFPGVSRLDAGWREVGGVALDPINGRLYVTQQLHHDQPHRVHVYDLSGI